MIRNETIKTLTQCTERHSSIPTMSLLSTAVNPTLKGILHGDNKHIQDCHRHRGKRLKSCSSLQRPRGQRTAKGTVHSGLGLDWRKHYRGFPHINILHDHSKSIKLKIYVHKLSTLLYNLFKFCQKSP